ncbi:hypothetical protein F0562_018189 [Nyssa sinensis]|uniref:SGNH hydrolase-type esterase domain-containing protein n=1 Tax=Nyssa sinensis TaxID=561372 RepID=A0A5J4ZBD1_9ASTE|nr:hypothetical protein F0562_018189 [Nyssa sinensis]
MACELETWFKISILSLVVNLGQLAVGEPQVPCYFIFGDSLVDNGNNNDLQTSAKVNYPPYGVDFPGGPTGRFTNGRTRVDILAELLGFEDYIPPFATARGNGILKGVNYGSGGAGIRNETGQQLGDRICLDTQLENHNVTISRIAVLLGNESLAEEHLRTCLYTVGMGSNDYINNYLRPEFYPTSRLYTPEQYAAVLTEQYSRQLRILYNYGARKVGVLGLGPIGCIPFEANGSLCVGRINDYVNVFNKKVLSLVNDLNHNLTDAHFIFIDPSRVLSVDPSSSGITILLTPCCKVSTGYGKGQCIPHSVPCSIRATSVFFDAFHPTEIVHGLVAAMLYIAMFPNNTYPIDSRTTLTQLSAP